MIIPDNVKQRFKEMEYVTPIDRRKMRNSCLSGHSKGEEKKCSFCQTARFNTLLSGYHGDTPTLMQVETFLNQKEFDTEEKREDYLFVLNYLGLPEKEE